jgi:7-carboxy-7-deazaguanine synthase
MNLPDTHIITSDMIANDKTAHDKEHRIRVSEIFGPTIQGEGALIGQPTVFVRTGGCDYRCSWCDSLYAVDIEHRHEWQSMTAAEIFAEIQRLSGGRPLMVSLSGGNPAIQHLAPLIELGHEYGYRFALETQGTISQPWFADLDVLTLSPKPPSSEMVTDWQLFDECLAFCKDQPELALKIVIFDDLDYQYAKEAAERYPELPIYLQPGNHQTNGDSDAQGLSERLLWLTDKVMHDRWFTAKVLPQLHVMMWGNQRGV